MKYQYIINGTKIINEKGFYSFIESEFTSGLKWKIGRNLNAFNDVLLGGFGKHDYGEIIEIYWTNYLKSKQNLDNRFLNEIIEILEESENVIFRKFDYEIK